jgi:hypothetical protein
VNAESKKKFPGWIAALSTGACLFFIGIRHGWLGPHLTQPALGLQLDKWQLGPLRVLNLIAFSLVIYWLAPYLKRLVSIEPFLTLGKASLRVFCAHIFFVFVGLTLLVGDVDGGTPGDIEQLHGFTAIGLLVVTFVTLMLVAANEVRKAHAEREKRHALELTVQPFSTTAVSGHDAQAGEDAECKNAPAASPERESTEAISAPISDSPALLPASSQ